MTHPIQEDEIDRILDTYYYDREGCGDDVITDEQALYKAKAALCRLMLRERRNAMTKNTPSPEEAELREKVRHAAGLCQAAASGESCQHRPCRKNTESVLEGVMALVESHACNSARGSKAGCE